MPALRTGQINGVLSIPPDFSRDLLAGNDPRIALIEDNTDQFSSSALAGSLTQLLGDYNRDPVAPAHAPRKASLSVVELYPYVPYIQFLLPGTIVLAIFVSAMIGGGIIFIDDKARGLHEGYLVTPISKFELILGFNLAGVIKADDRGRRARDVRLGHRRHSGSVERVQAAADARARRADGADADQHDVPADGAGQRPARAARRVRRA